MHVWAGRVQGEVLCDGVSYFLEDSWDRSTRTETVQELGAEENLPGLEED